MRHPPALHPGDKIAIVSLSRGMLGEDFCAHNRTLGTQRLRELGLEPVFMPHALDGLEALAAHPEHRAADLKAAFADPEIKGIITAIGGDDTYRLAPYLMEDEAFLAALRQTPKLFTGFSDTTLNHLMLYKLGLATFYGPAFIPDVADIGPAMLPYTHRTLAGYLAGGWPQQLTPSDTWYEERTDFSAAALGTPRTAHREQRGWELLQGPAQFSGPLLGGCIESLYDLATGARYLDEPAVGERYGLFPPPQAWRGKLVFLETSEETPTPAALRTMLQALKARGVFEAPAGILVGKPMNERYYEEYKSIWREVLADPNIPILYNLNSGHATPRCALPYAVPAQADAARQTLTFLQSPFAE